MPLGRTQANLTGWTPTHRCGVFNTSEVAWAFYCHRRLGTTLEQPPTPTLARLQMDQWALRTAGLASP